MPGGLGRGDAPSGEVPTGDLSRGDVQTAIEMAALHSQLPLWQQMVAARERLQHATLPHPSPQAALAAFSQLPGRIPEGIPRLPGLPGIPGFPFLSEFQSSLRPPTTSNAHLGEHPGVPANVMDQVKQEMLKSYLRNLAQSSLHGTTSGGGDLRNLAQSTLGGGEPLPASNQNIPVLSTSQANSNPRENTAPRNGDYIGRDSRPPSLGGTGSNPFLVGLQLNQAQQQPSNPVNNRPPTNGGPRRTSNGTGREKVFTCTVCDRSFGYKHVLQNHERTHTGEKPFECKECHKRFTRDHHLKTHMRLHTGEKPYSCSHCDRKFVQVANLRRHLRVHTGERPYKVIVVIIVSSFGRYKSIL